jgi:hypothetical protein
MIASQSQLWTSRDIVKSSSSDRVTIGACIDLLYTLMIVLCWLLAFSWFGWGNSKVGLVGWLIGRLLDIGKRVKWWLSHSSGFFCRSWLAQWQCGLSHQLWHFGLFCKGDPNSLSGQLSLKI